MSDKKYEHELSVEFGGVSIGDATASIGVGFERNGHSLENVEAMLCGKSLEVLAIGGSAALPGQKQLPGMEGETHPHVEASCDSASLRVTPKQFGSRLRFSLSEIAVQGIAQLAKRHGTLRLNVLGDLEEAEDVEDDDSQPKRSRQTRLTVQRPPADTAVDVGANMAIEELARFRLEQEGDEYKPITKAKCEALRESELEIGTVGKLEKVMKSDPWWHQKVKGYSQGWIDRLTNSLLAFRQQYLVPVPVDGTDEPESAAESPQFADPHGPGTECSTEGSNEFTIDGNGFDVRILTAKGTDGKYRACSLCDINDDVFGREIPIEESQPYETENAAARGMLSDLIAVWKAGEEPRPTIAAELEKHLGDFEVPADTSDVPFGQ